MEKVGPVSMPDPTVLAASGATLSTLQHEPRRLSSEADKCNAELESLVMDNYRVFVENLTCSVQLRAEDKNISNAAVDLSKNLVELSLQCSDFRDKVNQFVNSHKRNRKTLQHHMQLVDLLEVPQLVDACARNGFHDEALELANFVNGLERRHLLAAEVRPGLVAGAAGVSTASQAKATSGSGSGSGSGPTSQAGRGPRGGSDVIQSIVDDVHASLLSLRGQLLSSLAQHSSLPKEMQTIATLRKLDSLLVDRQMALDRHDQAAAPPTPTPTSSSSSASASVTAEKQREAQRQHLLHASEVRLQMAFLEARTLWLERTAERVAQGLPPLTSAGAGAGAGAGTGADGGAGPGAGAAAPASTPIPVPVSGLLGPYGKAIELLEASRTSLFAVATQFNALFGMEAETGAETGAVAGVGAGAGQTPTPTPTHNLLSAWLTLHIRRVVAELTTLVADIEDGAAVRGVLEQVMFFAARMGLVGGDFRVGVVPLFQAVVVKKTVGGWALALERFRKVLVTEKMVVVSAGYGEAGGAGDGDNAVLREVLCPLFLVQDQLELGNSTTAEAAASDAPPTPMMKREGRSGQSASHGADDVPAPNSLLAYPPLAHLFNAIIAGLSFLRECPMVNARHSVAQALHAVLVGATESLCELREEVRKRGVKHLSQGARAGAGAGAGSKLSAGAGAGAGAQSSEGLDKLYAKALACDLVPHALACFDHIYSTAAGPGTGTGTGTGVRGGKRGGAVALRIASLGEAADALGLESLETLERVWVVLQAPAPGTATGTGTGSKESPLLGTGTGLSTGSGPSAGSASSVPGGLGLVSGAGEK